MESLAQTMWMMIGLLGASALLAALCAMLSSTRALHLLQLESYQIDGYFRACRRQRPFSLLGLDFALAMLIPAALGLPIALFLGVDSQLPSMFFASGMLFAAPAALLQAAAVLFVIRKHRNVKAKKPLVYTKRVKRLMIVLAVLNLAAALLLCTLLTFAPLAFCLLPPLQALMVPLAAFAVSPVEKAINRGFFRDAQRILRQREDLIKIGITGSYGKTSTKFILAAILSEKYNVLATPSSFNTPMGLTRVVREQLRPEHQVFLAEMGARHVGDIAELCELTHPAIGALTSIGPQHLETFHTLENVASTKFELIDSLPAGGAAFFSEQVARDFPERAKYRADIATAVAGRAEGCDVRASDISVGPEGSSFLLHFSSGETLSLHTRLLGAHNIDNIALCCAVARHLGLTGEQIARGVAAAEPIEHRLQLIRGAGGNVVIDDAFNANPAGAKAALDVLMAFPGRKIIVTPGMVELGEREEELNRIFGGQIARAADIAILIGEGRSRPILEGLLGGGFPRENAHVVASLDAAAALLGRIAAPGDVTLFENDLPDNYEE